MQGATTYTVNDRMSAVRVSIHAPYAGSDSYPGNLSLYLFGFNPRPLCRERLQIAFGAIKPGDVSIHAPYAGSDAGRIYTDTGYYMFQSTPPMQGATVCEGADTGNCHCFNPRPLCRERQYDTGAAVPGKSFNPRPLCRERHGSDCFRHGLCGVSIHAPYAGSDLYAVIDETHAGTFQSTPPMQGATRGSSAENDRESGVSIHAPYAGSDERRYWRARSSGTVSIHAPYAGSDADLNDGEMGYTSVSIHAPYAGSDRSRVRMGDRMGCFNPRPLCRERLNFLIIQQEAGRFNPRPLCRERQQFQPKILPYFQQKSTNYHFKYLNFPFFHPLFVYKTRRLCTFKSANPPAFLCPLPIRTLILSQNQRIIHCNSTVNTHMFHFCLILISQIIESQAVNTLINNICQY